MIDYVYYIGVLEDYLFLTLRSKLIVVFKVARFKWLCNPCHPCMNVWLNEC